MCRLGEAASVETVEVEVKEFEGIRVPVATPGLGQPEEGPWPTKDLESQQNTESGSSIGSFASMKPDHGRVARPADRRANG